MVGVLPGVHQNKHVVSTDAHHQKHNQKVQETKILNLQRDRDRETETERQRQRGVKHVVQGAVVLKQTDRKGTKLGHAGGMGWLTWQTKRKKNMDTGIASKI